MKTTGSTVYFETYSIVKTLLLYPVLRKASKVIFHVPVYPDSWLLRHQMRHARSVKRLVSLLFKKVSVECIPQEETNALSWESNKASLSVIDEMEDIIHSSGAYKTVRSLIRHDRIDRYMQFVLARGYVSNSIAYIRAAHKRLNNGEVVIAVPGIDTAGIIKQLGTYTSPTLMIPKRIRAANVCGLFCHYLCAFFMLGMSPSLFLLRRIMTAGIVMRQKAKKYGDVLMRIIWGFDAEGYHHGVRLLKDDGYLCNEKLGLKSFVYILDRPFSKKEKQHFKSIMDKRQLFYVEQNKMALTGAFGLVLIKEQLRLIGCTLMGALWHSPYVLLRIGYYALYDYFMKLLECEYVDYKVEFGRDDAVSAHIMRAIVADQRGKKTVCLQHNSTAGPYVFPQLCYVYCSTYCVFSDAHMRLHAPYWERLNVAKIGNPNIDIIVHMAADRSRVEELRAKMQSLYGALRRTVLISLPNPIARNSKKQWDELYVAIETFTNGTDATRIFLRFRSHEHLTHPWVERFVRLAEKDERVVIDLTNFTTYELMVLADVFISSTHSSGLLEAAAIGKRCFSFYFMGTTPYCFGRYGKGLILKTKEDVLEVIRSIHVDDVHYDCDWDLLRKEFNYTYAGDSLEKLHGVVAGVLERTY